MSESEAAGPLESDEVDKVARRLERETRIGCLDEWRIGWLPQRLGQAVEDAFCRISEGRKILRPYWSS